VIGVVIANLDLITGAFSVDEIWKPFIVAVIMAILSPVMALLGKDKEDGISET
jgi:uncharacterized membrane protein YvlD (DUF360 family)